MIKHYKLNFYIQSKNYATQKLNNGFIFDHAPPNTLWPTTTTAISSPHVKLSHLILQHSSPLYHLLK